MFPLVCSPLFLSVSGPWKPHFVGLHSCSDVAYIQSTWMIPGLVSPEVGILLVQPKLFQTCFVGQDPNIGDLDELC